MTRLSGPRISRRPYRARSSLGESCQSTRHLIDCPRHCRLASIGGTIAGESGRPSQKLLLSDITGERCRRTCKNAWTHRFVDVPAWAWHQWMRASASNRLFSNVSIHYVGPISMSQQSPWLGKGGQRTWDSNGSRQKTSHCQCLSVTFNEPPSVWKTSGCYGSSRRHRVICLDQAWGQPSTPSHQSMIWESSGFDVRRGMGNQAASRKRARQWT